VLVLKSGLLLFYVARIWVFCVLLFTCMFSTEGASGCLQYDRLNLLSGNAHFRDNLYIKYQVHGSINLAVSLGLFLSVV